MMSTEKMQRKYSTQTHVQLFATYRQEPMSINTRDKKEHPYSVSITHNFVRSPCLLSDHEHRPAGGNNDRQAATQMKMA